ncbi:MAG: DDE transposase family protein [Cyanobacteria bacterium P01_E01_bin.45]
MAESNNEGPMAGKWYVVQRPEGHCEIVDAAQAEDATHWGPFASQGDAIARRIGLIRSGQCQPV